MKIKDTYFEKKCTNATWEATKSGTSETEKGTNKKSQQRIRKKSFGRETLKSLQNLNSMMPKTFLKFKHIPDLTSKNAYHTIQKNCLSDNFIQGQLTNLSFLLW